MVYIGNVPIDIATLRENEYMYIAHTTIAYIANECGRKDEYIVNILLRNVAFILVPNQN
jgi:hypothetical protein